MLALDVDSILADITAEAKEISGIRTAFDYDEWPDSPPGAFNKNAALHLTGFPEEGDGFRYIPDLGINRAEWRFIIPCYTVVLEAAKVKRARSWVAPYLDRYRLKFDLRPEILNVGEGNTGSIVYRGATIARTIQNWDAYSGFYMLRHTLDCKIQGPVDRG